ncbi:hypothetical protein M569_14206, partial [Genlisea aurea]
LTFIAGTRSSSWHPSPPAGVDTTASSYWFNGKVLLCSVWILISAVVASILISKYESPEEDDGPRRKPPGMLYRDQVWRPCLESIHPVHLLVFRLFGFVVLLLMLVMNVVVDGGEIFYYYTQWTFALVTIYFALGSVLSIQGCYNYAHHIHPEAGVSKTTLQGSNREKAGFFAYAFQIIFQMNAGAVILTDTVFWFVIVPFLAINDYKLNFLIVNMHVINAVFLLAETAMNSLNFPWFRIGYFILWTGVYVGFQWILHASTSIWWPYPFLELSSSYSPLWYLAVAVMHVPCYGVFLAIVKGKRSLLSKWFPQSY